MPSNESNDHGSKHLRPVSARDNQLVAHDPRAADNLQDDETIDIRELWRSVLKHKWVVAAILAIALVSTFLVTSLMIPMYRSAATLQIDPAGAQILNYQNFTDSAGGRYGTLSFYQSQLAILRSRGLSESVVRAEGIEDHPELNGEIRQRSVTGELRSMFQTITSAFKPGDRSSARPLSAEQQRELQIKRAASALRSRLSAKQMPDTNLISVAFDSYSGQFAARVANAVVMEYKRSTMQRRYDAGSEARGFLQEQLGEMRIDLERADQALLNFAEETQVADLEKRLEMTGNTISDLNQRLTEVETELIKLQGYKSIIESGQAGDIKLVNENEDIRQLRRERAQIATEYASLSQRFKEGYPELVQLRNKMDTISDQIDEERTRAIRRILSQHSSLAAEAEALRNEIESREQSILALNQQGVRYNILKRDFETNRELYDGLLQRMKEIGVATGVQENNIAVIDSALPANSPYKPQLGRNLVMALAVGLMVGVGLALVLEFFDSTIHRTEELEALTGRPVLGLVPIVKARDMREDNQGFNLPERAVGHYSARFPKSSVSEAFRSLRTSLMFSTPEGMPKTILVTSPGPGDGKTTTAINLATVMAQNGSRVLLVDADLRKPRLHRDFGKSQSPGLTDCIAGSQDEQSEASTISQSDVERLFVMPSGNQPPNPAELLSSDRMAKVVAMSARTFDHVIIDTAPILGLADSIVLSRLVDGVIVVAAAGATAKESIKISMRRLAQVRAPVLGVVLNSVDFDSADYAYYSSDYYNYESDNTGDNDQLEDQKALGSTA
jgi:polysaccharide biosynthesis transport protein